MIFKNFLASAARNNDYEITQRYALLSLVAALLFNFTCTQSVTEDLTPEILNLPCFLDESRHIELPETNPAANQNYRY